jgi:hypothetical protein
MVTTPDMTARLEEDMDSIVEGQQSLEGVVAACARCSGGILDKMESEKRRYPGRYAKGSEETRCRSAPRLRWRDADIDARKSGKRFAGCGATRLHGHLPASTEGSVVATGEVCEEAAARASRSSQGIRAGALLDPGCPTKEAAAAGRSGAKSSAKEDDIE